MSSVPGEWPLLAIQIRACACEAWNLPADLFSGFCEFGWECWYAGHTLAQQWNADMILISCMPGGLLLLAIQSRTRMRGAWNLPADFFAGFCFGLCGAYVVFGA